MIVILARSFTRDYSEVRWAEFIEAMSRCEDPSRANHRPSTPVSHKSMFYRHLPWPRPGLVSVPPTILEWGGLKPHVKFSVNKRQKPVVWYDDDRELNKTTTATTNERRYITNI